MALADFGKIFGDGKYVDSGFSICFFIFLLHSTDRVGMWLLETFFFVAGATR